MKPPQHIPAHEDEVRRILLGEATEAERLELVAACSACRDELEEYERLFERVDGAGRAMDEDLAEADALPASAAEDEVADLVRSLAAPSGGEPHGGPRAWWLLGLAAAVLAAVFLPRWLASDTAEQDEAPIWMGEAGDLRLESPVGTVDAWDSFAWTDAGDEAVRYEVFIYAEGADQHEPPLLVVPVQDLRWTPTDSQRTKLPAAIQWRVDGLDRSGEVCGSSLSQSARLRSP